MLSLISFLLIVIFFIIASYIGAFYTGPKTNNIIKLTHYECGVPNTNTDNIFSLRLSIKYYLIAILFILFDVEVVFLYPWATALKKINSTSVVEMIFFIIVFFITYLYIYLHKGLNWIDTKK